VGMVKVESDSLSHLMRDREFKSIAIRRAKRKVSLVLERRQLANNVGETPSVRIAQIRQFRSNTEPLRATEIFIRRAIQSLSCDPPSAKNKAVNALVCIQRIRTTNHFQLNRSERRKPCGRSLSLTCESEPCAFFQTCATRTSRQPRLILRSITMTPNSTLTSESNRK